MNNNFYHYSQNRDVCPVCDNARKDCRRSERTGLIHCRAEVEPPNGLRFVGIDEIGFGMFAEGDRPSIERKVRPAVKPQSSINVLTNDERDRQFRQIAKHAGLATSHRENLIGRELSSAFTQECYENGLIFTFPSNEYIPGTTVDLPGIDPATGRLRKFKGLAIAIPDAEGRILGAQYRGQDTYRWVSSGNIDGANHRLANGEAPIGLYGEHSSTLNFAEGFLKPLIAAERFGLYMVGAAGGDCAKSPEQLHAAIDAVGATEFILNPDGGMLDKKHRSVISAYERLHKLLKEWGHELKVRWWGQASKADGDIDEIDQATFDNAQLISWDEFLGKLEYELNSTAFENLSPAIAASTNDWQRMEWGQFKGVETRAILLDSPGIDWPEVQADSSITIAITEGGEQGGCLQDRGEIPAIALPGITGGVKLKSGVGLIPEIEALCQPGRLFVLCFDSEPEEKRKTRKAIRREGEKLRKELAKRGCYLAIATWLPDEGKGIDDVWGNHGTERVKEIIGEAISRHQAAIEATQAAKQRWQEQKAIAALNRWVKSRRFTPTHTINKRFVELEPTLLKGADIVAIKSGMGTGKTEALCKIMAELISGAVAIGCRNSLLLQLIQRLGGFYHLHNDSAFNLTADPHSKIATCIDSLVHFGDNHFDGKVIILDEYASTIAHLLRSGTLKNRRTECIAKFERAISRASVVIALDGNNSDIAINHLVKLRGPDCRVLKLLNEHLGPSKNVQIANPINPETGLPVVRSHAAVLKKLANYGKLYAFQDMGVEKAIAIISDSQRLCEALDETLKGCGLDGIRVDSKTLERPETIKFLESGDKWIEENNPDYVILSPTAESGIDISIENHFGRGFAFFHGILDTNQQTQFINRFRKVTDWVVSCPPYTTLETHEGSRSPHAREIEKHLIESAEMELKLIQSGAPDFELAEVANDLERKIKTVLNDQNTRLWAKLQAQRNYERQNTRACLVHALTEQGHEVSVFDCGIDGNDLEDEVKDQRAAIIERDSEAIFNSPDIPLSEAIAIKTKFGASLEDRQSAEKAILLSRLPGIELSEHWTPNLLAKLLFKDRAVLANLERYWAIQNLDSAKAEARERWKAIAGKDSLFLPDVRLDFARAVALKSLKLERLFTDEWFNKDSEVVQDIYKQVKRSKRLQTALGMFVGKQSEIQLVGRLIKMIGGGKESQQATTGDRDRSYLFHSPEADPLTAELLKSIQRRHENKSISKTAELLTSKDLEDEHPTQKRISIRGEGVRPETPLGHGIERDRQNNYFPSQSDQDEYAAMMAIALASPGENDEILAFLNQFDVEATA